MEIKRFYNEKGNLFFEDEIGTKVDFSGWNCLVVKSYELKNKVKVADMVREFCINIDPRSKEIFSFIKEIGKAHNTNLSFDSGDVSCSNVILSCYINYPNADYDIDVKLIYDSISKNLTPSIEFMYGSRARNTFGFTVFQHFSYDNLEAFYSYINTYLSEGNEEMLKEIIKEIYNGL